MSRMKPTRRAMLGAAAAILGGFAAPSAFADEGLERALAAVARARASLKTLVGPFTQTRTIGLLAAKVRSTGTLTLVRPDRLRWELAPPDDVVYWVTPAGLAYRNRSGSGTARAANAKIAGALDDLRIVLGGDLAGLRARYDLAVSGADDGPVTFEATPKAGVPNAVQHLTFTVAVDRVTPVSAVLVEGPRDRTEIVFGTLEKNVAVDPARVTASP
jgi:outer membrane lipoprotein-sorting protein